MSTVKSKKLQVGTDASASNNFTIYQPATPDGTLRIGVGNADSPTEVGQFNANGYKPATFPTFRARLSGNQTLSASTETLIQFNTTDWDTTNGDFDTTTYSYTPSIAGYYQVNAQILFNTGIADQKQTWVKLNKNGSSYCIGVVMNTSGTNDQCTPVVSTLVYLNGTTDYIGIYGRHGDSSSRTIGSNSHLTNWTCYLVQPA
jgi:hypothetical protein